MTQIYETRDTGLPSSIILKPHKEYIRITPKYAVPAGSQIKIIINFETIVPNGTSGLYEGFYDEQGDQIGIVILEY